MEEELEEIQMPIGNFIMNNAKGVMCDDGVYYHYAQVCRLLRLYHEEKTKPIALCECNWTIDDRDELHGKECMHCQKIIANKQLTPTK